MRFTAVLRRQHIGFFFKKHWQVQGKRNVLETNARETIASRKIDISDPNEYLKKRHQYERFSIDNIHEKPTARDESHPDYKPQGIYIFGDSNVPVEGVYQTQVLLNTLAIDGLPEKIEERFKNVKLPTDLERSAQQSFLVSHLLDAEQMKTAKIKDPLKPMRVFPRNYGITEARRNLLLSNRLLSHCERFSGHIVAAERKILNDAFFVAPIENAGDKVQFEVTAETFMTSKKALSPFTPNVKDLELPDIFPLKETLSIPKVNFYDERSSYPIKPSNEFSHPHTILLHYSNLDVKNLFDAPVTLEQFESRGMIKGFAVAASRAQSLYGKGVKTLKKPIVVQVVQIDGRHVQFGIFQLNSLDLKSSNRNLWFRRESMDLYDECCYSDGRPLMSSYNFDVLRLMSVFYSN